MEGRSTSSRARVVSGSPDSVSSDSVPIPRDHGAHPAGTPVPLGLVAFGIPVFIAGMAFSGLWSHAFMTIGVVTAALVVFGGIVQFLAGMWAFRTGEVPAATFFGVFGGVLGTLGVSFRWAPAVLSGVDSWPLAIAAGCLCFVALYLGLVAWGSNPGVAVSSLALAVCFFFAAWSLFAGGLFWATAVAGWAAMVSGGLALICSAIVATASSIARLRAVGPMAALLPLPVSRTTTTTRSV